MELKSKQGGEIERIDKYTSYQLPNKFKIVGSVLFILSLISVFIISIYLEKYMYFDVFQRIGWTVVVLSLLMISISKEKIEDELMTKIRMQSYHYAVIGTVLTYLILPFIIYLISFSYSSNPTIQGTKDIPLLGVLIGIQITTFRKLKRAYNEK